MTKIVVGTGSFVRSFLIRIIESQLGNLGAYFFFHFSQEINVSQSICRSLDSMRQADIDGGDTAPPPLYHSEEHYADVIVMFLTVQ